jgi:anti-sigma B factor antagonist
VKGALSVARPTFSVRVVREGGTLTLQTSGEIDMATAPSLAAALDQALDAGDGEPGPYRLVVDLTGVGFLDSAGLHVLADLATRLDGTGCELVVVSPAGTPPRRVVELTGLTERLGLTSAHPGVRRNGVPAPRRP